MKKLLIILLLIVGAFAQETDMDALEKQMLYKQNDRSPMLAGLCALTPSMGHLYMGEWNKRLLPFSMVSTGVLSGVLAQGFSEKKQKYTYKDPEYSTWGRMEGSFALLSLVSLVSWYYLQMQDAIYLAYQHNADLYEEIYGKEYIRPPKKSSFQKWINKKEAKKNN